MIIQPKSLFSWISYAIKKGWYAMNSVRSLIKFVIYLRIAMFQELLVNDLVEKLWYNIVKTRVFVSLQSSYLAIYNRNVSNKIKQSHAFYLWTIYQALPHQERMSLLRTVFPYQFTYDCFFTLWSGFHNTILGITIYTVILARFCIYKMYFIYGSFNRAISFWYLC